MNASPTIPHGSPPPPSAAEARHASPPAPKNAMPSGATCAVMVAAGGTAFARHLRASASLA